MEGAIDCKSYQFLDARDRDGGRKSLLRGLAKVPHSLTHTHIHTHTHIYIYTHTHTCTHKFAKINWHFMKIKIIYTPQKFPLIYIFVSSKLMFLPSK